MPERGANEQNNQQQHNKKQSKTKKLADYPIWMYQNLWWKIISKVKPRSFKVFLRESSCKFVLTSLNTFSMGFMSGLCASILNY